MARRQLQRLPGACLRIGEDAERIENLLAHDRGSRTSGTVSVPMTGAATGLLQQLDGADRRPAFDPLDHVVDGQRRDRGGCQRSISTPVRAVVLASAITRSHRKRCAA